MDARLTSGVVSIATVAFVGFFLLFPQFKPDWIQIGGGGGKYAGFRRGGFPTRETSWSAPPKPVRNTPALTPAEAAFDRGMWRLEREEWDEASKEFSEVIRLEPKNVEAFHGRGAARHSQLKYDEAITNYDAALRLQPENADVLLNRAQARFDLKQDAQALIDVEAVIRLAPDEAEAYRLRGNLREEAREYRLALQDYELSAKLDPENPVALNCVAWLLSTAPEASLRDGRRAVEAALRSVRLEGAKEWDSIDTLAAALAEAGKFAEAIRSQNEALRLAPAEEHEGIKSRLDLYLAQKPYRLPEKSP